MCIISYVEDYFKNSLEEVQKIKILTSSPSIFSRLLDQSMVSTLTINQLFTLFLGYACSKWIIQKNIS